MAPLLEVMTKAAHVGRDYVPEHSQVGAAVKCGNMANGHRDSPKQSSCALSCVMTSSMEGVLKAQDVKGCSTRIFRSGRALSLSGNKTPKVGKWRTTKYSSKN